MMNLKIALISYGLTLIVFLIVDLAWLGIIAKNLYSKYLGEFMTDSINWTAAIIFYLIFVAGLLIFVIYPSVEKNSVTQVLVLGALFGIITYSTYDLTNLATLKGWPIQIVIIDIIWGSVLSTIVSLSGYYIVKFVS